MNALFKILRLIADLKAVRRGPGAVVRRQVNRRAHRSLAKWLRRL